MQLSADVLSTGAPWRLRGAPRVLRGTQERLRTQGARGGASRGQMEGEVPGFLVALQAKGRPEAVRTRVHEQDLRQCGLTGKWATGERPRTRAS